MPTELELFRDSAMAFIAESIDSNLACPAFGVILSPELHEPARRWQHHMFESGWAGLYWPAEFGGQGLTRAHDAIWHEECARARVAPYLNLQGIVLAGEAIMRSGTQAQKERYLRSTLSGDTLWCQLFSEPGAGSDLASLQSRATEDGGNYMLSGQKVWSSNAQFAQMGILLARTHPEAPRHRGISFFLLDMSLPGIDIRPLRQITGEEEFCEVFFDDVSMPSRALLGPENEGWRVAMEVLSDERGSVGASGVITLEHKLAEIAALAFDSEAHSDGLAQLLGQGQALKALLNRLGSEPAMAPVAKLARTEVDTRAEALAATLRGPDAMLSSEATDRFLYAPGMRIAGGTSEIQRNLIGERLLGLPREP